jgi:ABC-2 type transport system permease protein
MFLYELKANRKSTLIWTFSLVMVTILFFAMFPAIAKQAEDFTKLLASYPEALRRALGLAVTNIGTILGFYTYIFLYISLVGAIQAMNLGTSVVSKEIREKTADFLLTKPVSRKQIITAKLLAAVTSLIITNAVYLGVATAMALLVATQEFNLTIFFMLSLTLLFIQIIFLALGFILSVAVAKIRSVLPISLGSVFALFFIGALAASAQDDALRYFSPFQYFNFPYIIRNAAYEPSFLWTAGGFVVLAVIAGFYLYVRQDIHAVS